ncbi:MAG: hypothetical protein NT094_03070, partial [Candidatus Staskawiczbacteria bacterium]|nr:hypothetical protein [Candidatus Staskawiczbacteria bacterium]
MIEFIIEKTKKNWEFILIGFLWLCVWATYNTDIFRFFSPGFPHNFFDLIHGIRSFFPFLALTASISILIKGKKINYSLFKGPLGLILFYSIIGMIASIFSKSQVSALYWAILYSSVVIVLLAIINSSNPLKKLFLIININWVIAGIIAFSL